MPPAKRKPTIATAETPVSKVAPAYLSRSASGAALAAFETRFAKMGFTFGRAATVVTRPAVIPTGSINLDLATRIGGYPCGRLVELHGPEQVGKTSLAMLAVASAQQSLPDKDAAWVDVEGTFDAAWAATLGVDLERLVFVPSEQVTSAEAVADATKLLVEGGMCSIVVLDSVGAMISRKKLEGMAGDATPAEVARVMTHLVQAVSAIGNCNNTLTLIVNQHRDSISTNPGRGSAVSRPGGHAFRHLTSMRVGVRTPMDGLRKVRIGGEEVVVGKQVACTVSKLKLGAAGRTGTFWLMNQPTERHGPAGIDLAQEAASVGPVYGAVKRAGAWYTTSDEHQFQGEPKLVEYLRGKPEMVAEIRRAAVEAAGVLTEDDDDETPILSDSVLAETTDLGL